MQDDLVRTYSVNPVATRESNSTSAVACRIIAAGLQRELRTHENTDQPGSRATKEERPHESDAGRLAVAER
jgi:hypothetical protein